MKANTVGTFRLNCNASCGRNALVGYGFLETINGRWGTKGSWGLMSAAVVHQGDERTATINAISLSEKEI